MGLGVRRRPIVKRSSARVSASRLRGPRTVSGSLPYQLLSRLERRGTYVMDSLKASYECPY